MDFATLPPELPATQEDYWAQARRPLAALLFLLPLLAVYEFGVLCAGTQEAARNGADSWLRGGLVAAGVAHPWVLPAALLVILGGWHVWERHPWCCSLDTLIGMYAESLLFAMTLVVAGQLLHLGFEHWTPPVADVGGSAPPAAAVRAISYLGAGIYEEVLFRLALLPVSIGVLRLLLPRAAALTGGVIITSLLFAAAHYIEPGRDGALTASIGAAAGRILQQRELWFGFAFRAVAGVLFALLFLKRGFGVTVGCHALYDLLVGVVMQPPGAEAA